MRFVMEIGDTRIEQTDECVIISRTHSDALSSQALATALRKMEQRMVNRQEPPVADNAERKEAIKAQPRNF